MWLSVAIYWIVCFIVGCWLWFGILNVSMWRQKKDILLVCLTVAPAAVVLGVIIYVNEYRKGK